MEKLKKKTNILTTFLLSYKSGIKTFVKQIIKLLTMTQINKLYNESFDTIFNKTILKYFTKK